MKIRVTRVARGAASQQRQLALFANEAFYLAFAQKDAAMMARLWAEEHPAQCIHPGWPAIVGRKDIVASWQRILGNPKQSGVDFYNPTAQLVGNMVMVTCYEQMPGSICVASNGFVLEGDAMRMFHHQSGPCANPPPARGPG